ncbi:Protein arginine N-methyltransferase 9 (Protein arginine N-methyltransferase 10) [Durusdinium trenchii]|uniref:Protein arginine N-methyltransferase 9 (Protein arginine N-methyltransferase 10) n=1 Tax=Durusdinium trenchii TaxID=1381693 RepID=A0ABP0JZH2_9DINO
MNDALCSVAQEVIASQKHSCPVTLHPAVSTALKLPKFDLIFCEVFDAGLLGEHALPTILHARKELLKADGLLIPARARIFGQLVEVGARGARIDGENGGFLVPLKGAYLRNSERYTCETMSVVPHVALTEPVQLVSLDFQEIEYLYSNLGTWIDPPLELHVTKAGAAHALVYWWVLPSWISVAPTPGNKRSGELRETTTETSGETDDVATEVKPLTFSIDQALHLHEGDQVHLHLRVQATLCRFGRLALRR